MPRDTQSGSWLIAAAGDFLEQRAKTLAATVFRA